jgi:hypothetical protein
MTMARDMSSKYPYVLHLLVQHIRKFIKHTVFKLYVPRFFCLIFNHKKSLKFRMFNDFTQVTWIGSILRGQSSNVIYEQKLRCHSRKKKILHLWGWWVKMLNNSFRLNKKKTFIYENRTRMRHITYHTLVKHYFTVLCLMKRYWVNVVNDLKSPIFSIVLFKS